MCVYVCDDVNVNVNVGVDIDVIISNKLYVKRFVQWIFDSLTIKKKRKKKMEKSLKRKFNGILIEVFHIIIFFFSMLWFILNASILVTHI